MNGQDSKESGSFGNGRTEVVRKKLTSRDDINVFNYLKDYHAEENCVVQERQTRTLGHLKMIIKSIFPQ